MSLLLFSTREAAGRAWLPSKVPKGGISEKAAGLPTGSWRPGGPWAEVKQHLPAGPVHSTPVTAQRFRRAGTEWGNALTEGSSGP